MHVVAKISPTVAVPLRLEGNVELTKEGLISITYKEKGQVKPKNRLESPDSVVAYMEGEAGFAIVLSNDPVASFFGAVTASNAGVVVKTPEGNKVHVNTGLSGVLMNLSEAEEDSREARMAMRAAKVKAKVKSKGNKKSKSDKADKKAKKKKKRNKG